MYVGLFVVVTVVACFNFRRTKRMMAANPVMPGASGEPGAEAVPGVGAVNKLMPFMSFFTLFTVAVVPLAAALYVVTSSTWAAVERAALYR